MYLSVPWKGIINLILEDWTGKKQSSVGDRSSSATVVGIQYVKEVIEGGRHGRRGVLRGIIIGERWKREKVSES